MFSGGSKLFPSTKSILDEKFTDIELQDITVEDIIQKLEIANE
ncbi:3962_t:CDS:1, partial [Cetraspora pellucida]